MANNDNGLTIKQRTFCDYYLADKNRNATKAYQEAYPDTSYMVAAAAAARLLKNVNVQKYIESEINRLLEKLDIKKEDVLKELKSIGFSRMSRFVSWGPNGVKFKDSKGLSDEDAACVAEVLKTQTSIRFRLHNKVAALVKLGEHLGMFKGDGAPKEGEPGRIIIETYTADGKKVA